MLIQLSRKTVFLARLLSPIFRGLFKPCRIAGFATTVDTDPYNNPHMPADVFS